MLMAVASVLAVGCSKATGVMIDKSVEMTTDYTAIDVEGDFEVTMNDTIESILVRADEAVMPNVVIEKRGSTLHIRMKGLTSSYGTTIYVQLPYGADFNEVSLSGCSYFTYPRIIDAEDVEVSISGSSQLHTTIKADRFEMSLSGNSKFYGEVDALNSAEISASGASEFLGNIWASCDMDIHLSGKSEFRGPGHCQRLDLSLSGDSKFYSAYASHKYLFEAGKVTGSITGSSRADVHCDGMMDVTLSGSSMLCFSGDADFSNCRLSGSSKIERRDD